ncbi:MAG: hypothetical protein R2862_06735 [Thermoanaerobaculia bacterium]
MISFRPTAPSRSPTPGLSRFAAWGAKLLAFLLVAGHLLLLVRRVAEGTITEPGVLIRWLASVATLATAGVLWRRGLQPLRGRTGLAFLLVIVLLHAGGAAPAAVNDASARLAVPSGLFFLALSAIAIALGRLVHGRAALPAEVRRFVALEPARPRPFHGHPASPFASRPPPHFA